MDLIAMLRKIPDWNDLLALPKKVAELESRIKALEGGESVTFDRCPKCKKPTFELISSSPNAMMGEIGAVDRLYRCNQCSFEETKIHVPK